MRIIGGSVGGRVLRAPRGLETRPTSDRVREAIFNILGPPPEGARVLDLFAGSGALGLEAGAALARLEAAGERFTWIFLDPPYRSDDAARLALALGTARAAVLAEDPVVIAEHDRRRPPPEALGVLARGEPRRYGDTAVSFYRRTT